MVDCEIDKQLNPSSQFWPSSSEGLQLYLLAEDGWGDSGVDKRLNLSTKWSPSSEYLPSTSSSREYILQLRIMHHCHSLSHNILWQQAHSEELE